jgi:tetratricopeptide (TPR) repeat protein
MIMDPQTPDPYRPCPCGSGKKYKFCCRDKDREAARQKAQQHPFTWTYGEDEEDFTAAPPPAGWVDPSSILEAMPPDIRGHLLLKGGEPSKARKLLREALRASPDEPIIHNNLALAEFAGGNVDQAIELSERVLRDLDPRNVFAMGSLVHYYLVAGREAEARAMGDRIEPLPATREDEWLTKKCDALARLRRHDAILRAVSDHPHRPTPKAHFFAGVACANRGLLDKARDHLQIAASSPVNKDLADRLLHRLRDGKGPGTLEGNWPYFTAANWMPTRTIRKFMRETENAADLDRQFSKRGSIFAEVALDLLNEMEGKNKLPVMLLGTLGTPRAIEILRTLAGGTFGTDDVRMEALFALTRLGVCEPGATHKVWIGGEWREIRVDALDLEAGGESEFPVPEPLRPEFDEAFKAGKEGRWADAERRFRDLTTRHPDCWPAHHALTLTLLNQKKLDEAEEYVRSAMDRNPGSLPLLCIAASMRLYQGRGQDALDILDGIELPKPMRTDEYLFYLTTRALVECSTGNVETAWSLFDLARKIRPTYPPLRPLKRTLSAMHVAIQAGEDRLTKRLARREAVRSRPLGPGAPIEDCYGAYTAVQLSGMARAVGLSRYAAMKKGERLEAICRALRNPERVRAIRSGLSAAERAALDVTRAAGGRHDYAAFTREHGADDEDLDEWGWKEPESVLGRLKCLGLLVEGTVEGKPSVMIPAEIAASLEPGKTFPPPSPSSGCAAEPPTSFQARAMSGREVDVASEIAYIQGRAAAGESRVVSLPPLVFFSTADGDAWILDAEDNLAARLMRGKEALPSPLRAETGTNYEISWNSRFDIRDGCFWEEPREGTPIAYPFYPAGEIEKALRRARGGEGMET